MPWGPRASSCPRSLRAGLGTEFPVASKGAEPSSSRGAGGGGAGSGKAILAPPPDVRSARRLWSPARADGTRAAWSQALLGTLRWHFLVLSAPPKGPGNHMQNKVSRHCLEGERIREGKGKVPQGQPPGAWELLPAAREMSAPPGSPRDLACVRAAGCTSQPPRYRVRVCRPGVLARCVSASSGPAPGGRTLTVPILQTRSTRLRTVSSWQVTRMVWKSPFHSQGQAWEACLFLCLLVFMDRTE